jgi:serine/threonine-protein kinase RsbW
MGFSLMLRLPRDELSVPVARHVVRTAMEQAGVTTGCVDDVELALSEACTNVLLHAGPGDEYDVSLELPRGHCVLRVIDVGRGFDAVAPPAPAGAQLEAERGRGLALMEALVDRVQFASRPQAGTIVRLEKRLTYADRVLLGARGGDG